MRREESIRTAFNFLAGRSCTPAQTDTSARQANAGRTAPPPLDPAEANAAQREVPGLF